MLRRILLLKRWSVSLSVRSQAKYERRFIANQHNKDEGIFHNIRIVDLTSGMAGPYCTQLFGDMGAEVIKVEQPGIGDKSRQWGPGFIEDESCFYISTNRNKKSLTVDLTHDDGKEIICDLVAKSDIYLEDFIPGEADKMGIGFAELSKTNNRLIYTSLTAFGAENARDGCGLVASAEGGLMSITGPEDGEPCVAGMPVTELITGMYVHGAVCAAIYEREVTNRGKYIHCSLLASQLAYLSHVATSCLNTGNVPKAHGSGHGAIVPYQSFETGDDHEIVVCGTNDKFFSLICQAIGLPRLAEDCRFVNNAERVNNRDELLPILQERFHTRPSLYWIEKLDELGVPCGRVNNMTDVFNASQVRALNLVQNIQHPTAGVVKVPASAIEFDDEQLRPVSALHPPLLGEHTIDVLKTILHYNDDYIKLLLENDVVTSLT